MDALNLREALAERVLVGDGGMGTMLQSRELTAADFDGAEGCNEMLNLTRPDVVRAVTGEQISAEDLQHRGQAGLGVLRGGGTLSGVDGD